MQSRSCRESDIPEECRQVWRNCCSFLDGELESCDCDSIHGHIAGCPRCQEFVEGQTRFHQAVQKCFRAPAADLPSGLQSRVLAALDGYSAADINRTAAPDGSSGPEKRPPRGGLFLLVSAGMLLAASVLFAAGLFLYLEGENRGSGSAPASNDAVAAQLRPLAAHAANVMSHPSGGDYAAVSRMQAETFPGASAFPCFPESDAMPVIHGCCHEVEGERVLCAVFGAEGETCALLTFRCDRLSAVAPGLEAAEVVVDGRLVCLWRENGVFRALVSSGDAEAARKRARALRLRS